MEGGRQLQGGLRGVFCGGWGGHCHSFFWCSSLHVACPLLTYIEDIRLSGSVQGQGLELQVTVGDGDAGVDQYTTKIGEVLTVRHQGSKLSRPRGARDRPGPRGPWVPGHSGVWVGDL